MNLSKEKTKDFIAGLIALVFVVTAGYLALNRFNEETPNSLGTGGSATVVTEDTTADNTMRTEEGTVAGTSNEMVYWVANDYQAGDIQSGTYEVVSGDTLWELSEAVYGDGARWGEILNANADSIGYLPNGSQALIFAGQTLLLP